MDTDLRSAAQVAAPTRIALRLMARGGLLLAVACAGMQPAWAHSGAHPGGAKKPDAFVQSETEFGRAIPASQAQRTITVEMLDTMRFVPDSIVVKRGEKVRIVVRNAGKVLHELVIGTRAELEKHAELMRRFPGMEHDEPYMAHVDPGNTGQIAWQFTQTGEFMFGCLIPGHFEAGMFGRLIVEGR
jgi:uncharacterized cupredoxin-like copper-binding protein